jgi:4-hydroxy-tetrahydrodipicolinate synthase
MDGFKFKGVGTALVTPFSHGMLDLASLEKIVEYNIEAGIDFLVPLGTTGETSTLSESETNTVLQEVIRVNRGRLPIVCGAFAKNNTAAVLDAIHHSSLAGVDALLMATPYYNKPSQRGMYLHFTAIADASPVPIILYNVPSRTSVTLTAETILELAAHPNIIGVKEASGNFDIILKVLKYKPTHFEVLSGDDPITIAMMACGAVGVISVISNAFPGIFSEAIKAALGGDFGQARSQAERLLDIHPWLYIEGNPVGIKACLQLMDFCRDELRLPLASMSAANKARLEEAIRPILAEMKFRQ